MVARLDAEVLVADRTHDFPEADRWLAKFSPSLSMPVLAIFPGRDPKSVIVLRDLYTKADVLEKLRQAGPSQTGQPATPTDPQLSQ